MPENLPALVTEVDLERIATGDPVALRDAIKAIVDGLNTEIINRAQVIQPLLSAQVTAFFGGRGTLAAAPALGVSDAGFLYFITDFNHLVYWTGAIWDWGFGDAGNNYFAAAPVVPASVGWQLCDGTLAVSYVVVGGAVLATANRDMPDFKNNPATFESGAAYGGPALTAAVAPSLNNPANTGTDSTNGIKIGHVTTPVLVDNDNVASTVNVPRHPSDVISDGHTHPQSAVTANADGKMRRLVSPVYFRR